ncbi:MAG: hypothetical protein OEU90_08320 [Gammaproteobacteria bacterium]|jgi:hypothetical protein|nr:hypothetical protein [Gammaproteobacteria bacterium]MDH3751703.1 hypothetical protein [Gammaproteobacteria bacterium]MDH3805460.1 hypothetical protein [Gammaproteobacteria bacterium]
MRKSEQEPRVDRVVIAITELAPLQRIWGEALQFLEESRAELHALFVEDERWHRAASLPFTREISRVSGIDAEFTLQRAIDVHKEAIDRAHQQLRQLAAEAEHELAFEVLPESDQERIRDLVADTQCVVIAPAVLADQPVFRELKELGCRIMLIMG